VDTLSLSGYFWLPDYPDNKIAGILDFSTEAGGTLQLIGSFTSLFDLSQGTVRDTKRVIGSNIGETKYYTLDNCQQAALGNSQSFYVGTVIEGYAFDRNESIDCDEIWLSLSNLQSWLNLTGIEYQMTVHEATEVGHMQMGVEQLQPMNTKFSLGTLSINHKISMAYKVSRGELSERFGVKLSFNDTLPYADAMDFASDLQDLLTIASHRVSAFEKVELKKSNIADAGQGHGSVDFPARLWAKWLAQPKVTKHTLADQDMTFTFNHLGGIDGVGRWMTTAETYRSQLGRVMNTRYHGGMFQQDIHLARTAALESLHKQRWPNAKPKKNKKRVTLNDRLETLAAHAGAAFQVLVPAKKQAIWRQRIVDERNDVAHHLGRNLHQDIAELFYLSESTYWLFVIFMLREMPAPAACFDHLVQHAQFRRCKRELDALL
jgi:hypothetical protein